MDGLTMEEKNFLVFMDAFRLGRSQWRGLKMAISEVCQFELKEEVDKLKNDNPGLSLAECIRKTIEFYSDAGVEVKEETARTKYKRATKIGSNEPTQPTTQNNSGKKEMRNEKGQFVQRPKGPVNVVTSWTQREVSCCPIGADQLAKRLDMVREFMINFF